MQIVAKPCPAECIFAWRSSGVRRLTVSRAALSKILLLSTLPNCPDIDLQPLEGCAACHTQTQNPPKGKPRTPFSARSPSTGELHSRQSTHGWAGISARIPSYLEQFSFCHPSSLYRLEDLYRMSVRLHLEVSAIQASLVQHCKPKTVRQRHGDSTLHVQAIGRMKLRSRRGAPTSFGGR